MVLERSDPRRRRLNASAVGVWSYTDDEWPECVPNRPLAPLDLEQVMLLHRHWIWAKAHQDWYDAELRAGRPPSADEMASNAVSSMFLWYALLWSVLEALEEREVELGGRLAADIVSISDGLRRCRNAVFHISRDAYYDKRLFGFMDDRDSAPKIRRIFDALGRLLLEEFDYRALPGGVNRSVTRPGTKDPRHQIWTTLTWVANCDE